MDISHILNELFGEYPSLKHLTKKQIKNFSLKEHMSELTSYLNDKIAKAESSTNYENEQQLEGRLGPSITIFDEDQISSSASANICNEKLTITSQSPFLTVRANCCVFKGKWMYEVQLRSKGVMQIGWCSARCQFSADTGVGDTKYSYGLDGSKQRIWHVYTHKYGPYWRSGDVFGVCLNMDEGKIEYYRNGVSLGEAFSDIERGPGLALFPAVSLAFNDSLTANFGGSPFRHPVPDYKPLQQPPYGLLSKADLLLRYLAVLSGMISRHKPSKVKEVLNKVTQSDLSASYETIFMLIASILIEQIAPMLNNSYVIEDKVFSFIQSMCVIRSDASKDSVVHPGMPDSTLGTFLMLLWTYMEFEEMKCFLSKLINFIVNTYKETPIDLEYEKQRMVIVVLTCLCNHIETRKYLLENIFFVKNCLPSFLYIKPPDEAALEKLLPDDRIWTEGLNGPKELYFEACNRLSLCTSGLYTLQKNLIHVLLNNTDGDDTRPSSRKMYTAKFRKYVMENNLEHRGNITTPTQPAVALSFLCIVLDVVKQLFTEETPDKPVQVDSVNFINGAFNYFHFDRVGGVITHLRKIYQSEVVTELGEDPITIEPEIENIETGQDTREIFTNIFPLNPTLNLAVLVRTSQPRFQADKILPGNFDPYRSLNELLDCSVFYYYGVAHKYIVMIADLRDNIAMLSDILSETRDCSDDVLRNLEELKQAADAGFTLAHDDILTEINERFGQRKNIFAKRSMELARKQAWYRSVALGSRRRSLLSWLLSSILRTLQSASDKGVLFSFAPETYINILPILLDTVLDFSFHDMSIQHDLTSCDEIVTAASEFLGLHSADPRIVLASCKDGLLQALGTLTCHEAGVRALEQASSASQLAMVHALLRPYENRAWGQSNWLLLRFWLGEGFAFRESRPPSIWQGGRETTSLGLYRSRGKNGSHTGLLHHIAPSCPSKHFQTMISNILLDDEPYCTIFLNSVLGQLNWAFSEFILLLQEIQNISERLERKAVIESRQLKICSMCFELTVSLMRALEMIIIVAPNIVQDQSRSNSDLLLGRICQVTSQVFSRVTIPPGCFQHVLDLCLPDLSMVTHFAIISAALGILLALMKDEISDEDINIHRIPRVSKFLLTEPSFEIANLEFALGEVKTPISVPNDTPRGNFDPKMRGHIDPLTNETRIPSSARFSGVGGREIRPNAPILPFCLSDYPTHVNEEELEKVRKMIKALSMRQSLMSEITIFSEDSVCPICYAKAISAEFLPCMHQSCRNCIAQHLLSNKLCFYCKTLILSVKSFDGSILYENLNEAQTLMTPPTTPEDNL